jgi:MerR family copper efflux transcriptional regulator
MSQDFYNINEAARKLNVSTRTIRRYIKAGKIRAEIIKGNFGDEYRILDLPVQGHSQTMSEDNAGDVRESDSNQYESNLQFMRELQEKNLALAAQLGAAAERIRHLEKQLRLLSGPPARMTIWARIRFLFSGGNFKQDAEYASNERVENE